MDNEVLNHNNQNNIVTIKNTGILDKDFDAYANNFLYAGNLITYDLIKTGKIAKLDFWYFALVYLYRQSLELMLKANIFKLESDESKQQKIIKRVSHDLKLTFDEIITLSNTTINNNDNLIWLEKYLDNISYIDRASDMFRYPFGNDLKILFKEKTHIDLIANYYNFNRAFDILKRFYKEGKFHTEKYTENICYEPKLIVEGGSYYGRSVVGFKYQPKDYYPYYKSYIECGEFLRDHLLNNFDNKLLMPTCYIFRNALELGLKRIIIEDSHLDCDKKLKVLKNKNHSILGLWNSVCNELNASDQTIKMVTEGIKKIHNLDASSKKFRYPCDNDLKIYFKSETKFDIKKICNDFIELSDFLDGLDMMLNEMIEKEEKFINSR